MTSIAIRNIAPSTRRELAARAARRGQSMQKFVRMLLEAEVSKAL